MDERRSTQYYPDPDFFKLMLAIAGLTIVLIGMSSCTGQKPATVKQWNDLKAACTAECQKHGKNFYEFGTSFAGDCRCTE